jgi:hypothetical protein
MMPEQKTLLEEVRGTLHSLLDEQRTKFNRCTQLGDFLADRRDKDRYLGFGVGSSIYASNLVIGRVSVGNYCWIGPYTVLGGSVDLDIGDFATISSGDHVYTHDNIKQTLTLGWQPIMRKTIRMLNKIYTNARSITDIGIAIHHHSLVAPKSFIKTHVEPNSIMGGSLARKIGQVVIDAGYLNLCYDKGE